MVGAGGWIDAAGARLDEGAALDRLATARIALLGERHDRVEDHLWQARVIAGLAARRRPVVVGFEMFPRHARPALDAWVAGGLDRERFLEAARWREVWGMDPDLYMPIFELCRAEGIAMRGLNVDRPLVSLIGRDGWEALPEAERGWLSPARPASPAYRRAIFDLTGGVRPDRKAQSPEDPAFDRFARAQGVWDRAFACGIAGILGETPEALAVGVIGRGHLERRLGVVEQLDDLGVGPALVALPDGPAGAGDLVIEN
ncbi:ChaN family lipoprotein [Amaricoccus sp.]|uniref:ChaN family lipoprotein n=1 Tax=Amaricoccus sp. TaxID=1872485 RepID=UPI001B580D08|nr:ChaN family lipoprotein [Amaricoccus sp.]MBP7241208.1 ChaN family lipoprotein [Amaricoccus sp.]